MHLFIFIWITITWDNSFLFNRYLIFKALLSYDTNYILGILLQHEIKSESRTTAYTVNSKTSKHKDTESLTAVNVHPRELTFFEKSLELTLSSLTKTRQKKKGERRHFGTRPVPQVSLVLFFVSALSTNQNHVARNENGDVMFLHLWKDATKLQEIQCE